MFAKLFYLKSIFVLIGLEYVSMYEGKKQLSRILMVIPSDWFPCNAEVISFLAMCKEFPWEVTRIPLPFFTRPCRSQSDYAHSTKGATFSSEYTVPESTVLATCPQMHSSRLQAAATSKIVSKRKYRLLINKHFIITEYNWTSSNNVYLFIPLHTTF